VGPDPLHHPGLGQPHPLESALLQPGTHLRNHVRLLAMTRPDDRAARPARPGAVVEGALDVGGHHIAEHTADEDQIGGYESQVPVGRRGVPGDGFHTVQTGRLGRAPSHFDVPLVQLDQPGADVVPAWVVGEGADQVAALAGAQMLTAVSGPGGAVSRVWRMRARTVSRRWARRESGESYASCQACQSMRGARGGGLPGARRFRDVRSVCTDPVSPPPTS